jgi:hypothetical protein
MKAPEGHRWHIFKKLIIATYGDTCWICGHGGARQGDHVIPVTERPDLAWDIRNCRPAHGAPGNKCPTCLQNCNQLKGGYSVERARRIIAERMVAAHSPAALPPSGDPVTEKDTGREW